MRVAIVNDLAVACEALRRALATDPSLTVAWVARDGAEAVECAKRDRPDLVLMDLVMPKLDGVAATREIMRAAPCPILVVTATVSGNAALVYEALGAGALDAVNTPTLGGAGGVAGAEELVRRIRRVARAVAGDSRGATAPGPRPVASAPEAARGASIARAPILAIGASTGGPSAIAAVLAAMPRPLPCAVVVVQPVASEFAGGFAEWLAAESRRSVRLARAGEAPRIDEVVIAGDDSHLVLCADGTLRASDEPRELVHRPSVDELFASLARHAPAGVAVLLTGMGRDGAEGLARLRAAGWHTIAQDEATSVVWGMPGAAHRLGAAVETLPLGAIGGAATAALARRGR
jgi:chemotaxis response regulator CheB